MFLTLLDSRSAFETEVPYLSYLTPRTYLRYLKVPYLTLAYFTSQNETTLKSCTLEELA